MNTYFMIALVTLCLAAPTVAVKVYQNEAKKNADLLLQQKQVITPDKFTVRLVQQGKTFCSGVVIDKNTIATAGHCILMDFGFAQVLNSNPIEIRLSNNKPLGITGRAASASMQLDRGVIKGDFRRLQVAPYINDVKETVKHRIPNKRMVLCGYPLGGPLYCAEAIYLEDIGFFLKVKGVLIPGMSGGPAMLEDFTVVGTNTAVMENFSIIAPIYNVDMYK